MSHSNYQALLNDEEVLTIVKNASHVENASIVSWTLKQKDGEMTGFLGGYWKLHIEAVFNPKEQPVSFDFFVKTMPTSSEQREFMEATNLFLKEATIYSDLLSPMASKGLNCAAKSYFSRNNVLVLEDLTLKGYKLMPPRANFTQKHVQMVLKSLANLHAMSIHFEKTVLKETLDKVYDKTLFEVTIDRDNTWYTTGLKTLEMIALKGSKFARDPVMCQLIQDKLMKGFDRIYELVREVPSKYRKVVCHRDIWSNNLMFKFDNNSNPVDCVLVDFQLTRCLPPANDIMMALYVLQRTTDRKKGFLDNLKHYHTCLGTFLKQFDMDVKDYLPFDKLLETCEHFRPFGALIKALYIQTTLFPTDDMKKLRANDGKYRDFIVNDRSILLKYIDSDKLFRDWMSEAIEELVKIIVLEK